MLFKNILQLMLPIKGLYIWLSLTALVLSVLGSVYGLHGDYDSRRYKAGIASVVGVSTFFVPGAQPLGIVAGSLAISWRNE